MFDENDYPEKDAVIADRLCTPVAIDNDNNMNNINSTPTLQEWLKLEKVKPKDIEFEENYGKNNTGCPKKGIFRFFFQIFTFHQNNQGF